MYKYNNEGLLFSNVFHQVLLQPKSPCKLVIKKKIKQVLLLNAKSSKAQRITYYKNQKFKITTKKSIKSVQNLNASFGTMIQPSNTSSSSSSEAGNYDNGVSKDEAEQDTKRNNKTVLSWIRGSLWVIWVMAFVTPMTAVFMVILYPFVMALDKYRRTWLSRFNCIWAKLTGWPFYKLIIEGRENLPSDNQRAIYVANHTSYMDILAILTLNRSFKFLSKASIFKIPLIGFLMAITGHVKLDRMDKKSSIKCLNHCQTLLNKGTSIMFFPEGTRSDNKKLGTFKKGAFTLAVRTKSPVVPVSIIGTADLMPKGMEFRMYRASVKLIVSPMIESEGKTSDELCEAVRSAVANALPLEYKN